MTEEVRKGHEDLLGCPHKAGGMRRVVVVAGTVAAGRRPV